MKDIGRSRRTAITVLVRILTAVLVMAGGYTWYELDTTSAIYDGIDKQLRAEKIPVASANVGDDTIPVVDYSLFRDSAIWTYVNKTNEFNETVKIDLVPIPVEHGDASKLMTVAKTIKQPLSDLFMAAKDSSLPLMVASAYRSREDQQKLYNGFMTERGQEFTASRVAPPGTSEHQTGLAVDISSATPACAANSDKCELNSACITWLAENAPRFGFVQRYPMGKQSITGFSNEEWHYRYVGVPLAKALSASDMTFDEFVAQVAPGYSNK